MPGDTCAHPLVTVGVTCFNAEQTIERAVRSALAQRWPAIEVLVVDDSSTDGSLAVLERLALDDPRVRILMQQPNRGVAAARNAILEAAKGEFIAFFDDDDESRPDRLMRQVERIVYYEDATGTDLVVCHAARRQRFPDGRTVYEPTLGMDMTPGPHGQPLIDLFLLGRPIPGTAGTCATCSQMARRRTYRKLGGFDENLRRGEDTEFNLRLALGGGHIAGLSEELVTQDITVTSDKRFAEQRHNARYLVEKHREPLRQRSWYGFTMAWLDMKYDLLEGRTTATAAKVLRLIFTHPLKTILRTSWSWRNFGRHRRLMRAYGRDA